MVCFYACVLIYYAHVCTHAFVPVHVNLCACVKYSRCVVNVCLFFVNINVYDFKNIFSSYGHTA